MNKVLAKWRIEEKVALYIRRILTFTAVSYEPKLDLKIISSFKLFDRFRDASGYSSKVEKAELAVSELDFVSTDRSKLDGLV